MTLGSWRDSHSSVLNLKFPMFKGIYSLRINQCLQFIDWPLLLADITHWTQHLVYLSQEADSSQGSTLLFFFFNCSGFCHTLKWISHGFTCVPHPDPPSHLPLHPIPPGKPCMSAQLLSPLRLLGTPWTVARQAPLSMGFLRQEYWSELSVPFPASSPPRGQTHSLASPALAGRFLNHSATWEAQ